MRGWRKVYSGGRSWVAQEGESVIAPSLVEGIGEGQTLLWIK